MQELAGWPKKSERQTFGVTNNFSCSFKHHQPDQTRFSIYEYFYLVVGNKFLANKQHFTMTTTTI